MKDSDLDDTCRKMGLRGNTLDVTVLAVALCSVPVPL